MAQERPLYLKAPQALSHYHTCLRTFLTSNKHYTDVTVASFVFYPPKSDLITDRGLGSNTPGNVPFEPARLLLLQRSSTDASFPNLWEVPWGTCTLTDATILHSAKRTTFERTGLHTERILKEIGKGMEHKSGERLYLYVSFEIEIAEMVTSDFGTYGASGDIPIKMDPREHQDSAWVTEKDILDDMCPLVAHQSKDVISEAFRLRRRAEKQVRAQAIMASRARRRTRHGINSGSESTDGAGSGKDDDGEEEEEESEEEEEFEEEEVETEEEDEEEEGEEEEEIQAEDNECEGIMEPHLREEFRRLRESSQG